MYQWSGHVWKERNYNREFWINWVECERLQKFQKSAVSNQIARRQEGSPISQNHLDKFLNWYLNLAMWLADTSKLKNTVG